MLAGCSNKKEGKKIRQATPLPHRIRNDKPDCIPQAAGMVRTPRSTLRLAESANILFSGPCG
jgi:hypothetical protein